MTTSGLSQPQESVVVIGAGAAGVFAAIACAEANPTLALTLLEAAPVPLAKVRISGGGRCNVTHACFDPALLVNHYPRGGKALRGAFSRFQPADTVAWFQQRGVKLKTEADGRIFPTSDCSATIVDCLLGKVERLGIGLRLRQPVRQVDRREQGFEIILGTGASLTCDRLLLATGSSPAGYRIAQSLGHTLVPPVPSLFTFTIRDAALCNLAGVSLDGVSLRLELADGQTFDQQGPMVITHWGMSGPAVLRLSAYGAICLHQHHYQASLRVNWLPALAQPQIRQVLLDLKVDQAKRPIIGLSPFGLPRRLWQYLVQQRAGLGADLTWSHLSKAQLQTLVTNLTADPYRITGKGAFKEEFVTCGGVALPEVDFKTMASRVCPGLYLAGEILNIDGVTGGFNFQNAWTTGWLAGQAIAAGADQSCLPSRAD